MLVILICRDEFVTAVVWKSDLTIFIFLAEEERSLHQGNQLPTSSLVLMHLKQGVISKMDIEMVTAVIKENKAVVLGFFLLILDLFFPLLSWGFEFWLPSKSHPITVSKSSWHVYLVSVLFTELDGFWIADFESVAFTGSVRRNWGGCEWRKAGRYVWTNLNSWTLFHIVGFRLKCMHVGCWEGQHLEYSEMHNQKLNFDQWSNSHWEWLYTGRIE